MVRQAEKFVPATERQLSYLVSLATERGYQFANNHLIAGGGEALDLAVLSKRQVSSMIEGLKGTPRTGPAKPSVKNLATEKQLDYLGRLMGERGWTFEGSRATSPQGETTNLLELSRAEASALIDTVSKLPRERTAKPDPGVKISEDGMYRMGGTVYKVQFAVHGTGRLYAKRLVLDAPPVRDASGKLVKSAELHFEKDEKATRSLLPEHRMTKDDAKEFGDLYGCCIRCAAVLTDEDSIARGAGIVCFDKI